MNVLSALYLTVRRFHPAATILLLLTSFPGIVHAWDSASGGNPTISTHTHLTEYAITQCLQQRKAIGGGADLLFTELQTYREALLDGANMELHERPLLDTEVLKFALKNNVDIEAKRARHLGTNAGSADIAGWWADCRNSYLAGKKQRAFFYLGILLHMIQDMGVPAHAYGIYHQAEVPDTDSFEALGFLFWTPSSGYAKRADPVYSGDGALQQYYDYSAAWARSDSPRLHHAEHTTFGLLYALPDTHLTAARELSCRQFGSAQVSFWALRAALITLHTAKRPSVASVPSELLKRNPDPKAWSSAELPDQAQFLCTMRIEQEANLEFPSATHTVRERNTGAVSGLLKVTLLPLAGGTQVIGGFYPVLNKPSTVKMHFEDRWQSGANSTVDFTGAFAPPTKAEGEPILLLYSWGVEGRIPHNAYRRKWFGLAHQDDGPRLPDTLLRPWCRLSAVGTRVSSSQAAGLNLTTNPNAVEQPTTQRTENSRVEMSLFEQNDDFFHGALPLVFQMDARTLLLAATRGSDFSLTGTAMYKQTNILGDPIGNRTLHITLQAVYMKDARQR